MNLTYAKLVARSSLWTVTLTGASLPDQLETWIR